MLKSALIDTHPGVVSFDFFDDRKFILKSIH